MTRHHFDKLNRLPPYILAEVIDLMMSARRSGEDIIDLGMGNPDLPTPDHIVEKICEAAANPRNHRYSSSRGIPNLRAAITEWYARRHGVEVRPVDLARSHWDCTLESTESHAIPLSRKGGGGIEPRADIWSAVARYRFRPFTARHGARAHRRARPPAQRSCHSRVQI